MCCEEESDFFQVEVHGYRDSHYTLSLQATAERVAAASGNEGKVLPSTPVVTLASVPAAQQALPTAPEEFSHSIFLPVTLR